jgi:hypothetical protein
MEIRSENVAMSNEKLREEAQWPKAQRFQKKTGKGEGKDGP